MKSKRTSETAGSRLTLRIEHHTEKNVAWLIGFLNRLPRRISRKIDSITLAACGVGFEWREEPSPAEARHAEAIFAACLSEDLPDGFTGCRDESVTPDRSCPNTMEAEWGVHLRTAKPQ